MRPLALFLFAVLAGCSGIPQPATTAIIGAVWIDGTRAVPHAVVIVRDGKIHAVGTQQMVPIPAGSEKIDGAGKYVSAPNASSRLEAGAPADLVLLAANPLEDPRNFERVERRMRGGQWVTP